MWVNECKEEGAEKGRKGRQAEVAGEVMEGSATLKMRGTRKPGNMRREGTME